MEALSLYNEPDFNLKKKAKQQVKAKILEVEGNSLAREGSLEQAEAAFSKALSLNPELDFDPKKKAQQVRAKKLLSIARSLLRKKKVEQALAKYSEAENIDPEIKISAINWGDVCWYGVVQDQAAKVLDACEKAVKLDFENGSFRDSRGIARAMTGNLDGVVRDFEAYVNWAPQHNRSQERIDRRKQWIEQLKNNENPFSPEDRDTLLNELKTGG